MDRRTPKFCIAVTLLPDTLYNLGHVSVKTALSFRADRKDAPLEIRVGGAGAAITLTSPDGATFSRGKEYSLILSSNAYALLRRPGFAEVSAPVGRTGIIYVRNVPGSGGGGGVLFGGPYRDGRYKAAAARG